MRLEIMFSFLFIKISLKVEKFSTVKIIVIIKSKRNPTSFSEIFLKAWQKCLIEVLQNLISAWNFSAEKNF